ncbi:hypothetical protein WDZ11_22180 (plasmid) [Roseomonas mucosa]|uniref:restriction endonuclease subunit S n=1 Tax=Roseomonas mucosa TaxID=207340 RepID=UPI0030CF3127
MTVFGRIAGPLLDQVLGNRREAVSLGETRDLLLPKLMSGEIRVREAEKPVGGRRVMEDRQFLKDGAVGLLTAIAEEHPLGHQPSKAARFVLTSRHGVKVEIMFEKNMTSPPNLWCLEKAASPALIARLKPKRHRPAS